MSQTPKTQQQVAEILRKNPSILQEVEAAMRGEDLIPATETGPYRKETTS